ncbi:glycosyltransferase family 2 protein [Paraburkholderia ferrariae]|uniref:glycosyltransferase family 2 protein n=1 Tax=Paraburkholderia ferrariae TaxID=386056 RepID=UPI001FE1E898|nr:glycosyltransferase family 2 protein [Paraburkholderia ferrariae]
MIDLSYIVPAHNVEAFIEPCLTSLARSVGMTYEIVVVDDRSTDDTMSVVRKLAAQHPETRFVLASTQDHDEYKVGGLGAARNVGVSLAQGRYLSFVDSDDWIEARAFANLVVLLDRDNADFGWLRAVTYNQRSDEFTSFNDEALRNGVLSGRTVVATNLAETPSLCRFEPSSCNRVYRASFFREKVGPFRVSLLYEDVPTHYRALVGASRILITSMTGYYYRVNRPGQITSRNDEKRFDYIKILNEIAGDNSLRTMSTLAAPEMISYLVDFGIWCFNSISFPLRERFIGEFADALRRFPADWINEVLSNHWREDRQSYRLWLILNGLARDLSLYQTGVTEARTSFRFYLDTGRKQHARIAIQRRTRSAASQLARRLKLA